MNKEEIEKAFVEAKKELEMPREELLNKLWDTQQENKQLKDNWNKLKEYIVKEYYMYLPLEASTKPIIILTDKMQKLEQGSGSDE